MLIAVLEVHGSALSPILAWHVPFTGVTNTFRQWIGRFSLLTFCTFLHIVSCHPIFCSHFGSHSHAAPVMAETYLFALHTFADVPKYLACYLENVQKRALSITWPGILYETSLEKAALSTLSDRRAVSCIKFIGKVRPGNPLYPLIHNRVVPISTSVCLRSGSSSRPMATRNERFSNFVLNINLVNKCSVLVYISQLLRYPTIQPSDCKRTINQWFDLIWFRFFLPLNHDSSSQTAWRQPRWCAVPSWNVPPCTCHTYRKRC